MAQNEVVEAHGSLSEKLSQSQFWTAANMLSLFRAVLAIPIVYLIITGQSFTLLVVCLSLGIVSDWLDGSIARWTGTVSEWGKLLDPIADKIAAGGIVVGLVAIGDFPMWLLIIVLGRDLLIVLGGSILARKVGFIAMSMWTGKVAICVLAFAVLGAVLKIRPEVLDVWIISSAVLYIYSFLLYVLRYVYFVRSGKDGALGRILDMFANELNCAFMVALMAFSGIGILDPWSTSFAWLLIIWAGFLVLGGLWVEVKGWSAAHPGVLNLPVTLIVLLALAMFLEPDLEVIEYGQWISAVLVVYSSFFYASFVLFGARRDESATSKIPA